MAESSARQIRSLRELGEAVGVSKTTAQEWVRRDDWIFGTGPWSTSILPRVKQWRRETLSENPAERPGTTRGRDDEESPAQSKSAQINALPATTWAKVQRTLTQTARDKFKLELEKKTVHSIRECDIRRVRQAQAIRDGVLALPVRTLMPAGLTPEQETAVRAQMRNECEQLLIRLGADKSTITIPPEKKQS